MKTLFVLFCALALLGNPFDGPVMRAQSSEPAFSIVVQRDPGANARADVPLRAWIDAAEGHIAGQFDHQAKQVAGWSQADLQSVFTVLQVRYPLADENRYWELRRLLTRGLLLHTDIGILSLGNSAGPAGVLITRDGLALGTGGTLHFDFATSLLELTRDPGADPLVHAWYRAVTAALLSRNRLGDATRLITRWRQALLGAGASNRAGIIPSDAAFCLAYGCLHESFAAPFVRVVVAPWIPEARRATDPAFSGTTAPSGPEWEALTARFRTDYQPYRVHLDQAFNAYRRVVETNPRNAEARIRLGHVNVLRGSVANGIKDLRAGAEASKDDAVLQYYAAMFLGQALEARGQRQEARQQYEQAAALFPRAQSPLLALSALAQNAGDRPAARRVAARLFALPPERDARHDPWWDYDGGPHSAERLLAELYRMLQAGGVS